MSTVERIEEEIQELSTAELGVLREWFLGFDADAWDRQIEEDANSGKLQTLAERALCDHAAGRSTPL